MRVESDNLRLSASDLGNHLACGHLTRLNHRLALKRIPPPRTYRSEEEELEALQLRGQEHEAAYIEHLRAETPGLAVADLRDERSMTATVEAMRAGADVIVQATLESGRWMGVADILRRIPVQSELGDWSYEVIDTKLAQETRAASVLQISLYSHLLAEAQDKTPERMYIVAPNRLEGEHFREERYRVDDYAAYYRLVRRLFEEAVDAGPDSAKTYPEPVEHCDICRWRLECSIRRRDDDHLSLVADLGGRRMREVQQWGVGTLTQLAAEPLPLERPISFGSRAPYERAREQARVQLTGREQAAPYYEPLPQEPPVEQPDGERPRPPEPLAGLWRLPEPSPGDVFFDIEGDAFVWPHGFEYLFGWVVLDEQGAPEYRSGWAFGPDTAPAAFAAGEKALFERFIDEAMERWRAHPGMHVYHFAPYEPSALKRLMSRYASREAEVDHLLREERFVDLHAALRKSVVASVERYSIKDLEPFFGYERRVELHDANDARHALERLLEAGRPQDVANDMRDTVEQYNRDDCESTLRLRDWLEGIRSELIASGAELWRPERQAEAPEEREPSEFAQKVEAAQESLLDDVPDDPSERSREQQARWLLAHLLGWHRREEKAQWWELFALADMDDEELRQNRAGLVGLGLDSRVQEKQGNRTPVDRYTFPFQETALDAGDSLYMSGGDGPRPFGAASAVGDGWVEVKKRRDTDDAHPSSVFRFSDPIRTNTHQESLLRTAEWVIENGVDAPGPYRAARDLLLALPPRLVDPPASGASLAGDGELTQEAARRLALELDNGALAVQGPPGSGKTYTGARMICDLVRAGKKVGVTSNSHKVIRNLLDAVVGAAETEGLRFQCIEKTDGSAPGNDQAVREVGDNGAVLNALKKGDAQVAGGTAWMWTREEFAESVDVLFVDEAGQLSLANTLAMAPAARSLVLLGDPQQLDQPQQGAHPDGVGASALEHLLRNYADETPQTIPPHRGLFLERTWRLPPALCEFTSAQFYEGRLAPHENAARQRLMGEGAYLGAGLRFVDVEHEGNQNSSPEEAERVRELYDALLAGGVSWVDRSGDERPLAPNDILIVAPYNAQLTAIARLLPSGARVGTVDKFQGQEAPVVIYSMATSSPEDAPRGMEFLYSLNRLNVATSRAQCVSIVVASPRLFEPECRTPRQMQLANALCRYREMADAL